MSTTAERNVFKPEQFEEAAEKQSNKLKAQARALNKVSGSRAVRQRAMMLDKHGWVGENNPAIRKVLAALAHAYGLDPALGDIQILGGNSFYISKSAYDKKAQDDPRWEGWTFSRPANTEEREAFMACLPEVHREGLANSIMWISEFKVKERAGTFRGYGFSCYNDTPIAAKAKKDGGDPKGVRVLLRQAQKRAEHAALLQAYSYRMPDPKKLAEAGVDPEELKDCDFRIVQGDKDVEQTVNELRPEQFEAGESEAGTETGTEPEGKEEQEGAWIKFQGQIENLKKRDPETMKKALASQKIKSSKDLENAEVKQLKAAIAEFNRLKSED